MREPNVLTLNVRVRNLMLKENMTQKEFSNKIGMDAGTFSRLMTRQQEWNLKKVFSVADTYRVSLDWLLGLRGVDEVVMYLGEVATTEERPAKAADPEDEQIAAYVKEHFPYMLKTMDYKMHTMGVDGKNMISTLASGLMEFI